MRLTLPTAACTGWCIDSLPNMRLPVPRLKGTGSRGLACMDPLGFEPRASSLQRRHSTAELWAHLPITGRLGGERPNSS